VNILNGMNGINEQADGTDDAQKEPQSFEDPFDKGPDPFCNPREYKRKGLHKGSLFCRLVLPRFRMMLNGRISRCDDWNLKDFGNPNSSNDLRGCTAIDVVAGNVSIVVHTDKLPEFDLFVKSAG
jgi:hypothetical protein